MACKCPFAKHGLPCQTAFARVRRRAALIGMATAIVLASIAHADWPQYAANAARRAVVPSGPADVDARLWLAATDDLGAPIVFEGPSSPIVAGGRVFANSRIYEDGIHTGNRLISLDAATGAWLFAVPLPPSYQDSWSSPAFDAANDQVLVATEYEITLIDGQSGNINGVAVLANPVVNASPVVADDLSPGRAFITDFDPYGGTGMLYCINTAPLDVINNPFQPGDILWTEPVGGTSGNTPAYHDGFVYVASAAGPAGYPDQGVLYAFDVAASPGSRLRWQRRVGEGFFGGVCWSAGYVFAASYDFSGSGDNSRLVKVLASDGTLAWNVACERTASIPVVTDNRVYLSAGLPGFGSVPKIEAFEDHGTFASKLWDTHADTAGQLVVGGWTGQPVLAGSYLFAGRIPVSGDFHGPYTDLYIFDVTRTPADPFFVRTHRAGVGSSPASSGGRVFSIGPQGLAALAAAADFDADGVAGAGDIQAFVAAMLSPAPTPAERALADLDNSGSLDAADAALFVQRLLSD